MAFAGTFGAAANLVPFALIQSRQYGQAVGYDADGNIQFNTAGGTAFTPERVDDLLISGSGDVLAALVNNTDDGSAADTGVLVTAAPAANQHGLPANFGPGRGNWEAADAIALIPILAAARNTVAAATNAGGPFVRRRALAAGDMTVAIKNMSEVVLADLELSLIELHSVQG